MTSEQTQSPKIVLLIDRVSPQAHATGSLLWGYEADFIERKFLRAKINPSDVTVMKLDERTDSELEKHSANIIIAMGELSLQHLTGKRNLDKQHLSVLPTKEGFKQKKCIPTFPPQRIWREYRLQVYVEMAFRKAAHEATFPEFISTPERFLINPDFDITMDTLNEVKKYDELAIDLETGQGQINTFGVAWNASDAIAINVLPERFASEKYKQLMERISEVCEGSSRKIFQNGPYDITFLSRYGIGVSNFHHDTMWANKFLWPELEMGLGNVGRIYCNKPYWKDDGKGDEDKKNWGKIRNWPLHYTYSCRDTTGTFEGKQGQLADLKERGLEDLFYNYIMRLADPVIEMCTNGIPLSVSKMNALREETDKKLAEIITEIKTELNDPTINPRSPKQLKAALKSRGYNLPTNRDKATGESKESTNAKAIKKLRIKNPNDKLLPALLKFSETNKFKNSYLNITWDFDDKIRYLLNAVGTETGRMSGKKCAIGNGYNPQTGPSELKAVIECGPDEYLGEVDLRQAESRFVAYDAADLDLITMLEDPTKDIHKYVAAAIYNCTQDQITHDQRQLGKKSGHGANYDMHSGTFMETCLTEMDLVITKREADHILNTYHGLFPGIRRWHESIRQEVLRFGKLTNPIGRVRYFYGRLKDDATFREAYAYRPQSTIPDITNHLLLYALSRRTEGYVSFFPLLQIHDSLLFRFPKNQLDKIGGICVKEIEKWHPKIELKAGRLIIPTEFKFGQNWGGMTKWKT